MPDDLRQSNEVRALQGECPVRPLLDRMADKWTLLVILHLAQSALQKQRFSELMRGINGVSQRMVVREVFAEVPPRVEYTLTPRGHSFLIPARALITWLEDNWPDIQVSRAEYDEGRTG